MIARFVAPAVVLCLGLLLGSCSSFSGYMADHWPHWAGGLPADAPPRPGAPGYEEFIAHREQLKDAPTPTGSASAAANVPAAPAASNAPSPPARGTNTPAAPTAYRQPDPTPAPPSAYRPPDASVDATRGGLY